MQLQLQVQSVDQSLAGQDTGSVHAVETVVFAATGPGPQAQGIAVPGPWEAQLTLSGFSPMGFVAGQQITVIINPGST